MLFFQKFIMRKYLILPLIILFLKSFVIPCSLFAEEKSKPLSITSWSYDKLVKNEVAEKDVKLVDLTGQTKIQKPKKNHTVLFVILGIGAGIGLYFALKGDGKDGPPPPNKGSIKIGFPWPE